MCAWMCVVGMLYDLRRLNCSNQFCDNVSRCRLFICYCYAPLFYDTVFHHIWHVYAAALRIHMRCKSLFYTLDAALYTTLLDPDVDVCFAVGIIFYDCMFCLVQFFRDKCRFRIVCLSCVCFACANRLEPNSDLISSDVIWPHLL